MKRLFCKVEVMAKWVIVLPFYLFTFLPLHAQQDEMRQTVAYLASQELGGRYPGTAGDSLASDYIVGQLRSLKFKPVIKAKKALRPLRIGRSRFWFTSSRHVGRTPWC